MPCYLHLVSGSISPFLSKLLFNFFSRYSFAIGLNKYLVLEVYDSLLRSIISNTATLVQIKLNKYFAYMTITFYSIVFQQFQLYLFKIYNLTTTPHNFRFELFRFHSPLLTESLLISFPLLTKMFQFRRFPFFTKYSLHCNYRYSETSDIR